MELLRKFMMTSVIIFIRPDTLAQLVWGFAIAVSALIGITATLIGAMQLSFFILQIHVAPLKSAEDHVYQFYSLLSVWFRLLLVTMYS